MTLPNSPQGQSQCNIPGPQISSEQSTGSVTSGNGSPHSSPKHSPRQTHRKENPRIEISPREPSPFFLEKADLDQQVSLII